MQYTKVAPNTFQKLQMNAGILVDSFVPSTGVIGNILAATTGGLAFASNPTYEDFGENVDNVPANTMQLKRIMGYDPAISGTALTVDSGFVKTLVGAAQYGTTTSGGSTVEDETHIIPTHELTEDDFGDVWMIGDYSDHNTGATTAGFCAIHIMNALNIDGFQLQTAKNDKGQFAFNFHGHYDLEDIDTVPFEIYIKPGTAA